MARTDTHPDATALYAAVLAAPADDAPRLVFADWLEEHGDAARAEFIRVQCRLARMREWDEGYTEDRLRADRLAREHAAEWVVAPGRVRSGRFRFHHFALVRGFVGRVNLTPGLTPATGKRMLGHHPITAAEVGVSDGFGAAPALWRLESGLLPGLTALTVSFEYGCSPGTALAACLGVASPKGRRSLTRLELRGDPTPAGLETIVGSPNLSKLESLSLGGEGIGDEHARRMAVRAALPRLRELALGQGAMTPGGAESLGRADWFGGLEALRLFGNEKWGDGGVMTLLRRTPEALRTLHLHHSGIRGRGLNGLLSRGCVGLTELILSGVEELWGDELSVLGDGRQRYGSLDLTGFRVSGANAGRFFSGPALSTLRVLRLTDAWLDAGAADALTASYLSESLRVMELDAGSPADGSLSPLLRGRTWPHLTRLKVRGGVAGPFLLSLIESPNFPRLVSLSCGCYPGGPAFLKKLARSPAAHRLRELDLSAALTPAAARELADSPHLNDIDRLRVHKGTADPASCERLVARFGRRVEIERFNAH